MMFSSHTGLHVHLHRFLLLCSAGLLLVFSACSGPRSVPAAGGAANPLPQDAVRLEAMAWAHGFNRITDLHATASGQVYVVDAGRHHVIRLGENGVRIDSTGGRGTRPNQFDRPTHVYASNDLQIFVSDSGNRRIVQFDRHWQHLGYLDIPSVSYTPGALTQTMLAELVFWDERSSGLMKTRADFSADPLFRPDVSSITGTVVALQHLGRTMWVAEERGVLHRYAPGGGYLGFLAGYGPVKDAAAGGDNLFLLSNDGKVLRLSTSGAVEHVLQLDVPGRLQALTWQNGYLIVADAATMYRVALPE